MPVIGLSFGLFLAATDGLQVTFDGRVVSTNSTPSLQVADSSIRPLGLRDNRVAKAGGASEFITWDFPIAIIGFGLDLFFAHRRAAGE